MSLEEAIQTIRTTVPQYLEGATDHTIRHRPVLAMIQDQGNVILNMKAPEMRWPVVVREQKTRVLQGGTRHVFSSTNQYEQLALSHSEFEVTEAIDRRSQMINSGSPNAIVDLVGGKMDSCLKKATRSLSDYFYTDSTGVNAGKPSGLNSFIKPEAITNGDLVARPASGTTYAGKSVELGELGGQWSTALGTSPNTNAATDWPFGSGSTEYDYNTPAIFNTDATFGGSSGWSNNCLKLMRRAARNLKLRSGDDGKPVAQILGEEFYSEFEDALEGRERTRVSDYAKSLGFPDVLTYGDAVVVSDYACPSRAGYGLNINAHCGLYTVHDQLFFSSNSWENLEQMTTILVGFLGNYFFTPKAVCAYLELNT